MGDNDQVFDNSKLDYIVYIHGVGIIRPLKEAGVTFTHLTKSILAAIVKDYGVKVIAELRDNCFAVIVKVCGIEIKEAMADFTALDGWYLA